MIRTLLTTLIITVFSVLTGCDETYTDKENKLATFVSKNRIGEVDVWLEKRGRIVTSDWIKVILVFGYYDDYKKCEDIKKFWSEKYPQEKFRCNTAN